MNKLFYVAVLLLGLNVQGQKKAKKGYYIDNQNVKHECFVKDADWFNCPKKIEIKNDSLSNEFVEISVDKMKEFEIYGVDKYVRYQNEEIFNASILDKYVLPSTGQVMLKLLVEGEPSLYSLQDDRVYYFYKLNDKLPVYLEYINGIERKYNEFASNENYKQTLKTAFNLNGVEEIKKIEKLKYYNNEMIAFFNFLNKNTNENFVVNDKNIENEDLSIKIVAKFGYRFSKYKYGFYNYITDKPFFEDEFTNSAMRYGFMISLTPNFFNRKVSLFIDPNYSSESFIADSEDGRKTDVIFSHIQLPVGLSYALFRKNDFYINLTGALVLNIINTKSRVISNKNNVYGEMETASNIELGLSLVYKKYYFEIKNGFKKSLTPGLVSVNLDHNYLDFVLGYRLF